MSRRVIRTEQMSSFEKKLIQAIKQKRGAEGLSIRALASTVGVSFSTLARIERGEGQPDNNSKIRLLQWLGPDAEAAGLNLEHVALVHFRAGKNVRSATVQALLRAAESLRSSMGTTTHRKEFDDYENVLVSDPISLSKEDLETIAEKFRLDLGLSPIQPLDSLKLQVEGVTIVKLSSFVSLKEEIMYLLSGASSREWSAMSVPLDIRHEQWAVLLNDAHTIERQRVTVLEEIWHILLGHKLTKISRVSEVYGRTYDKIEEHDAFYVASASLLPRAAIIDLIRNNYSASEIAFEFGTSHELVDYRIKRLGLWREHTGKQIKLSSD